MAYLAFLKGVGDMKCLTILRTNYTSVNILPLLHRILYTIKISQKKIWHKIKSNKIRKPYDEKSLFYVLISIQFHKNLNSRRPSKYLWNDVQVFLIPIIIPYEEPWIIFVCFLTGGHIFTSIENYHKIKIKNTEGNKYLNTQDIFR